MVSMIKGKQLIVDVIRAFREKKIKPWFGSFGKLSIEDGRWKLLDNCGCAISALVAGEPCTVQVVSGDCSGAALKQVANAYGIEQHDWWSFVYGFDGHYGEENLSTGEAGLIGDQLRDAVKEAFEQVVEP